MKKFSLYFVAGTLVTLLITNICSTQTFENFLAYEKGITTADNHLLGWYGPNGKLKYESSYTRDGFFMSKHEIAFIDKNGKKIEISAYRILGFYFNNTK